MVRPSKKIKFLDTNAILDLQDKMFEDNFCISSISLQEMENIKTSGRKDDETKYKARKALHLLDENNDKYEVVIYTTAMENYIVEKQLEVTPDTKIIASCAFSRGLLQQDTDFVFVTNDIACKMIASKIFDLTVKGINDEPVDDYSGFIEKTLSESEMAYFYEHLQENIYGLLENEYLILKDSNNHVVDTLVWREGMYQNIKFPNIKSDYFGAVKPLNGDIYQQMALNSFSNNQITMIKGSAGTGKSYLAIGYMMWLLEKHKIDKIVIFANPTPTMNSAKIGFLPGTQLDKLVDSSIGNMLAGKLGDKFMIEQLVSRNKLSILPMCDIRGFDTSGLNCAVYITEAQNLDISLMKLALQRIGEDSICIVDGDYNAQVDLNQYAGNNNGMRRMSEIFRGQDFYGEVELQNIYRSRISQVAELM